MYGVVDIAGHQYQVRPGDVLDVEKLKVEEGATIDLENILLIGGENVRVGKPHVDGASVQAKVIKHAKDRKLLVFRRMAGKWHKKNGHRQNFTSLLITEVNNGDGQVEKLDPQSPRGKKYL